MTTIGEMARIVHDVRTIEPPVLPVELVDEINVFGGHTKARNLGALAVIADRMYSLIPAADQSEETKRTVIDAYANWMISVSILDDAIDETGFSPIQKEEYLRLGKRAFLGEPAKTEITDPALKVSLALFEHAGEIIAKNSNGQSLEALEPSMTELTREVAEQDHVSDEDVQREMASFVGGVCIAAPIIFAEALEGKSYPRERSASMALGAWAQQLDNIRDMKFDNETGQLTAEVIKLRDGVSGWRVASASLRIAREEFVSATAHLPKSQKRTIHAMANLMFMRYFIIHPTKTFLKFGKLTAPTNLVLHQSSAV